MVPARIGNVIVVNIRKSDIISAIWMGAFVGCFIILLIMVIDAYIEGPDTYMLPGRMIINSFYGTIIVGWAFTFSGLVYKTDIAFPVQIFFQISVGMSVMLIVAVKVHWMVVEWGMSEKLGPMTFGDDNDEVFLGRGFAHSRTYSEEVAKQIDSETKRIIQTAYDRAQSLLTEHIEKLHAVAEKLLEKEKIDGEEFNSIFE